MTKTVFSKLNKGLMLLVLLVLTGCQSDRDSVSDYQNPPLEVIKPVAEFDKAPLKFKNPSFNEDMLRNNDYKYFYRITPTGITNLSHALYNSECEFITEDDEALFLKCRYDNDTYYQMMISIDRYYFHYWGKCPVLGCSYIVDRGSIDIYGKQDTGQIFWSNNTNCEMGKIDQSKRFNCMDLLKERGWDKYIPATMPQDTTNRLRPARYKR